MSELFYYIEKQKISSKFLKVLVYFFGVFFPFFIVVPLAYAQYEKEGSLNGDLLLALIICVLSGTLVALALETSYLSIKVSPDGFYYKFFPFHFSYRKLKPEDVIEYRIVKINPMKDYGGWGIKYRFRSGGKGYICEGENGVEFRMKNGKTIAFTVLDPYRLETELRNVFQTKSDD